MLDPDCRSLSTVLTLDPFRFTTLRIQCGLKRGLPVYKFYLQFEYNTYKHRTYTFGNSWVCIIVLCFTLRTALSTPDTYFINQKYATFAIFGEVSQRSKLSHHYDEDHWEYLQEKCGMD